MFASDDGYTEAGWIGYRVGIAFGNTNAKPVAFVLDDFTSAQVTDYATDNVPVQLLWAPGANLADDYRT
ncbi:hypothetical protein [Rugosimonospora africana]|uniref:Uncharacterized protein n=1 Tax=Rugosimonospora africana TaxID=556532 RepID=A0A8J3VRL9_9ACTN|nr:hypothetical protein [Rugosimonospora africana]GIH16254.1 hypothetical protein Raf01_44260 [Rugosimonospora africana]